MTRDQICYAQRLLDTMGKLEKLKEEVRTKYSSLNEHSTIEEVTEFITFLVQNGFMGFFVGSIMNIIQNIDESIKELEEELKEL